jgi:hypothetical protein
MTTIRDQSAGDRQVRPVKKPKAFQRDVTKSQEVIYDYLLEIVNHWSPEDVLQEFKHLFIHHTNTLSSATLPSLYEIVFANQEEEFRNTLKRSCYILINNWDLVRNHKSIQALIQLFQDPIIYRSTMSPTLKRLRGWLKNFIAGKDFQELQLFTARYEVNQKVHWAERYTSYLLVPQYINLENPVEQRRAARTLSRKLKEKFKFDLAMYTAHSQNPSRQKFYANPTGLGDETLRLIKAIVARRNVFSYANLANIFLNQTRQLTYQEFKVSLVDYLVFSVTNPEFTKTLRSQLTEKLNALYTEHHDKLINDALLLRTCNRVIEYLLTENYREPSSLFIVLLSNSGPITLVIVLLKLVLICHYTRTQLEARIADLIRYYKDYPEEECQWVVYFFEVFNVVMAIYTENIEYSLVYMSQRYPEHQPEINWKTYLDACRIFSQIKKTLITEQELERLELKALEVLSEEIPATDATG